MFSVQLFPPITPPPSYEEAVNLPDDVNSSVTPPPKYPSPEKIQQALKEFNIQRRKFANIKPLQLPYDEHNNGVSRSELKRFIDEENLNEKKSESVKARRTTIVSGRINAHLKSTDLKPFSN